MAYLPYPETHWSEQRLRRLTRLVDWCVPAVILMTVLGVGLSVATVLRYGNRAPGGIAASVALAAVMLCLALPYVVYTRNLKRRLRTMVKAAESPPAGPMSRTRI